MHNNIQVFDNPEFGQLEILMIDGKPYFPATECAELLGYSTPRHAISRHCRWGMKRAVPHPQSPEKSIDKTFIPEGDLYRLIIRSKLPAADKFETWVFDEVLPSIRRDGAYINDDILRRMREDSEFTDRLLQRISDERAKNNSLLNHVEVLEPKARYYDIILQCPDAVQVSIIAKDYGMSAVSFNKLLHRLGIQFKIGKTWLLYSEHTGNGYTITKTYLINGRIASMHTCFTQRGRFWLYDVLKWNGILPEAEKMGKAV
jgi:prophage antirepressor-like protein